jgi:SHS2 domain-containing protein
MNVMIDNLDAIERRGTRQIELSNDEIDMLLFDFLQELIYFKDAERLLLRVRGVQIDEKKGKYFLKAEAVGEPLDAARHHQRADVKAVTLHDFCVEKKNGGWKARVILDI